MDFKNSIPQNNSFRKTAKNVKKTLPRKTTWWFQAFVQVGKDVEKEKNNIFQNTTNREIIHSQPKQEQEKNMNLEN